MSQENNFFPGCQYPRSNPFMDFHPNDTLNQFIEYDVNLN